MMVIKKDELYKTIFINFQLIYLDLPLKVITPKMGYKNIKRNIFKKISNLVHATIVS